MRFSSQLIESAFQNALCGGYIEVVTGLFGALQRDDLEFQIQDYLLFFEQISICYYFEGFDKNTSQYVKCKDYYCPELWDEIVVYLDEMKDEWFYCLSNSENIKYFGNNEVLKNFSILVN